MSHGSVPPDDVPARQALEIGRKMGKVIDHNAVKRAAEALRAHELRFHPLATAAYDEVERIPDATIRAIIALVEQAACTYAEAAEHYGVSYGRLCIDLADFENRLRRRAGATPVENTPRDQDAERLRLSAAIDAEFNEQLLDVAGNPGSESEAAG